MRILAPALIVLALLPSPARAYDAAPAQAAEPSQFTFAWPLGEGKLKPRGATTRGAPVTLDPAPGPEWRRLREPGLSVFERDRRAILAMAGGYRVSFDFLEVVRYDPQLKPDAPYQSWGTEFVFVAEDSGEFIALQHILVMRILRKNGEVSEPMVVRHWRQEWRYEPETVLVYRGAETWERREVTAAERRGAWSQNVYQVDDSARYGALGQWEHRDGHSTWISGETWRPLPRREFSVRKDYQVLVGTNRHTITPTGWVQEENNLKLVLDASGRPRGRMPYLAREYGVARYERIKDHDFEPGRRYFELTEPFWAQVRAGWREIVLRDGRYTLTAQVDQGRLFVPFFEYADNIVAGKAFDLDDARAFVARTLRENYLVK
jgi:hypothetical protein